jgi:putative ABC transport system permease protein
MTATVVEPRVALRTGNGGAPARRAMVRWAWRLFRREWRQQALILALLMVAVAATIVGLGVASNATQLKADPTFGTANTIVSLHGSDSSLSADMAAIQSRFGTIDVISHRNLPVAGSVADLDLRAQNPYGPYGRVTLRLDSGRFPSGPNEIAVTHNVAQTFGLHLGSTWNEGGRNWQVVGLVENPLNLLDQFALVAPGQANPATQVSILLNANQGSFNSFRLPSRSGLDVNSRGTTNQTGAEAIILVLGSLGLLFVGLMGVAGFTVMAQRRLRALGMLGSLGANDRHIRLVMLANGAAVGATAAIAGTVVGLIAWFLFVPTLQSISEHRIDRFALPWWAIALALILTFLTAVAAAWWPARTAARISIVGALSGRPPRPQAPHRFTALGGILLATGLISLAFADGNRAGFIIAGTVTTAVGLLFLAPIAIRLLASAAGRSTVAVRLALRDLSRYQARSGAALGAITLGIGVAATIAISASAAETNTGPANLAADQLMLYLAPPSGMGQVPPLSATQQRAVTGIVDQLAATMHARSVVPLDQAYDPKSSVQPVPPGAPGGPQSPGYITASLDRIIQHPHGVEITSPVTLYVATPAVLSYYGIKPSQIAPTSDIISSRRDLGGLQIMSPDFASGRPSAGSPRSQGLTDPKIQTVSQLPVYTSAPNVLITQHALQSLGLQPLPAGWLIQAKQPLTAAQIATARKAAVSAGLYVETHQAQHSLAPLRNWSTAAGILLALGVLAMTVGLIRSETANDLRTLTATGASSSTRRTLTGATAGALALLGAILGTAGAYAALLAWHRSDLSPLGHVPVANLAVILIGLPLLAGAGGWLLSGREPAVISRRPIE